MLGARPTTWLVEPACRLREWRGHRGRRPIHCVCRATGQHTAPRAEAARGPHTDRRRLVPSARRAGRTAPLFHPSARRDGSRAPGGGTCSTDPDAVAAERPHPLTGRSGQAAKVSQLHCSAMSASQSGHGTRQPAVAVVGSSASDPQPEHVHQLVVITSMPSMLNDTPVIFCPVTLSDHLGDADQSP